MRHLKITTAELAQICGVSQGTVDRALNNRSEIKSETKQRILDMARLYGYRTAIEETDSAIVGQIGIIVFNLNNEYFSRIIMEAERILRKSGLCTVIMMTHYDPKHEIDCIRKMYNMGVKGIILFAVNGGEEFGNYLKMFDIPIVAVGNNIGCVPYVGVDDRRAMYDMTVNVIKKGYREIIYFSPALNYDGAYAEKLKYEGFLSAVGKVSYQTVTDRGQIEKNYDKDTAVVCSNDYYAFWVYSKTNNVKVTGFDNLAAIDKYSWNIDSVGYSVEEATEAIIDIILNNKREGRILKHRIVERDI